MYCEKCMRLVSQSPCKYCKSKNVRPVKDDDIVFLTEQNTMFAGMLEDVLRQEHIHYLTRSNMGAALSTIAGNALERISIFVPIKSLDDAINIVNDMFGENVD